jgi:hypothetical protein
VFQPEFSLTQGVATALAVALALAACGEDFQPATQAEDAGSNVPAGSGGVGSGGGAGGGSGGSGGNSGGGAVGTAGDATDAGGGGGLAGDAAMPQEAASDAQRQDAAAFNPSTQACEAVKAEGDAFCDPFCERAGFVWGFCGDYPVGQRCGCSNGPEATTCGDGSPCDAWSCDRVCEGAGWLAGRIVAGACQCVAAGQFVQKPAAVCGSACRDDIACLPCPTGFQCNGRTCCELGAC